MTNRQRIIGSNNISLAGNINFLFSINQEETGLSKKIRTQIQLINDKVNAILKTEGLYSVRDDKNFPFDCERIIKSNSAIGIPIEISLSILENAENYFHQLSAEYLGKKIATTHVRKFVSDSLYQIESNYFSKSQTVKWAEEYSRRYGNPNYRLKVITSSGNEINLTFKYLKDEIVPDIIRKCFPLNIDEIKSGILVQGISQITEEIFEKIKQLNLHYIHYKTVFNIAYDLAIQPPKPWLCSPKYKIRNTEYELGEAQNKIERAKLRYDTKKSCNELCNFCDENESYKCHIIRKKCYDCIDHCSSILLNEYDLFIGSGQLRPFAYLRRFLAISKIEDGYEIIWTKTDLKKISGDLNAIGISKDDFIASLDKLKDLINNTNKDIIHMITNTEKFFLTTKQLINNKRKTKTNLGYTSSIPFADKIKAIFKHIPGIVVQNDISNNCFNMNQHISTVFFNKYLSKIKCLHYHEDITNLDIVLSDLNKIKNDKYCQLVLIVFNKSFLKSVIDSIKLESFEFEFIPISFKDLYNTYESKDRVNCFQNLIINIQNEI